MTCPVCKGTGEVEVGLQPGCTCKVHTSAGGAECTCSCAHSSEQCTFCDGIGVIAPEPDYTAEEPVL